MVCVCAYIYIYIHKEAKGDWDFRSLIWSKTLMELIFNPCGKFRWSPEGPVSEIHSPHLHVGAPGIFSDFFKVCSDANERVGCGKQREATSPIKSLVKLQPWILSLRWKTCLQQNCSLGFSACSEGPAFGQNTMMMIYIRGRRVIGISRTMIWSKTLKELIFNPCGEFQWSLEGPVSQIHSPHLHVGAPGIFSDLLRPVQMLKREWGAESNGKLLHLLIPSKTAT